MAAVIRRHDSTTAALLSEQDATMLWEAVTDAVLSASRGLRESIAEDPSASLALVVASRVAAEETSRLLQESVANARGAGHSWDAIGRLIGVSRQAAQQRGDGPHTGPRDRRRPAGRRGPPGPLP